MSRLRLLSLRFPSRERPRARPRSFGLDSRRLRRMFLPGECACDLSLDEFDEAEYPEDELLCRLFLDHEWGSRDFDPVSPLLSSYRSRRGDGECERFVEIVDTELAECVDIERVRFDA